MRHLSLALLLLLCAAAAAASADDACAQARAECSASCPQGADFQCKQDGGALASSCSCVSGGDGGGGGNLATTGAPGTPAVGKEAQRARVESTAADPPTDAAAPGMASRGMQVRWWRCGAVQMRDGRSCMNLDSRCPAAFCTPACCFDIAPCRPWP